MTLPARIYNSLRQEASSVVIGNEDVIEGITIAALTRGHVLLEGMPGVAKTTIANLFSRAAGLDYNRIQMTPDTLPADITGTQVYLEESGEFRLKRGPLFTNVAVVDEINRATPKTQSALLEAMEERAVTIDRETLALPEPFVVIATQNPVEMEGVYDLPKAQLDRFQFKMTVTPPDEDEELQLIDRFDENPDLGPDQVGQVVTPSEILRARDAVANVYVDERVKRYIRRVVDGTRDHPDLEYGVSPRATLALLHTAKARAAIRDREYVLYDDVKALVPSLFAHRVVRSTDAELSDRDTGDIVADVLESVELPDEDVPAGADPERVLQQGPVDDETTP